jgi:hypothetical protein
MLTRPASIFRRMQLVVLVLVALGVLAPLMVAWEPEPVEARRYGRRYNYSSYIGRCKRGCNRTAGVIKQCIRREVLGRGVKRCKNTLVQLRTDCVGNKVCRQDAQRAFKSCKASAIAAAKAENRSSAGRRCTSCCQRTRGQGACSNYFRNSRFYGSYRSYGRLFCFQNYGGSPSGAFLPDFSDRLRSRLAALIPFLTRDWSR